MNDDVPFSNKLLIVSDRLFNDIQRTNNATVG